MCRRLARTASADGACSVSVVNVEPVYLEVHVRIQLHEVRPEVGHKRAFAASGIEDRDVLSHACSLKLGLHHGKDVTMRDTGCGSHGEIIGFRELG